MQISKNYSSVMDAPVCYGSVPYPYEERVTNFQTLEIIFVAALSVISGVLLKRAFRKYRAKYYRSEVVIVGSGTTGLTSALICSHHPMVQKVTVFEQKTRAEILGVIKHFVLHKDRVEFLQSYGLDVNQTGGAWKNRLYFTWSADYLGLVLKTITANNEQTQEYPKVDFKFRTKFTRETLADLGAGRKIILCCDGFRGRSAFLLGLTDEFNHHNCKAFGAQAWITNSQDGAIQLPEVRIHDICLATNMFSSQQQVFRRFSAVPMYDRTGFHMKIFGTTKERVMCLATPRSEGILIKSLRFSFDEQTLRTIFVVNYNKFKCKEEPELTSQKTSTKHTQFTCSSRLFDVKLSTRRQPIIYLEKNDWFVLVQGKASMSFNLKTGMEADSHITRLLPLGEFLTHATLALTDSEKKDAMKFIWTNFQADGKTLLKTGIQQHVFL